MKGHNPQLLHDINLQDSLRLHPAVQMFFRKNNTKAITTLASQTVLYEPLPAPQNATRTQVVAEDWNTKRHMETRLLYTSITSILLNNA